MWLENLTFSFSCRRFKRHTLFSLMCAKTIWIHKMSVLILFSCRTVESCNLHARMTVWMAQSCTYNHSLLRFDHSQNLLGQSASQSNTCHNMVNLILVMTELNVDEYHDHNGCMKSSETASSETLLYADCHTVEWTFMSIERKKERKNSLSEETWSRAAENVIELCFVAFLSNKSKKCFIIVWIIFSSSEIITILILHCVVWTFWQQMLKSQWTEIWC